MDKRTLLAVGLSIAILLGYQLLIVGPPKQEPKQAPTEQAAPMPATQPAQQAAGGVAQPAQQAAQPAQQTTLITPTEQGIAATTERTITVDTGLYIAKFSSKGGTVTSWELKAHKNGNGTNVNILKKKGPLAALAIGWDGDFSPSNQLFTVTGGDLRLTDSRPTGSLTFTLATEQYTIRRTYKFNNDTYVVDIKDEVSGPIDYMITLGADFGIYEAKATYSHAGPVVLEGVKRIGMTNKKLLKSGQRFFRENVKWIAIEDKYFGAILSPTKQMPEASAWSQQGAANIAFRIPAGVNEYTLYAGPKKQDLLKAVGAGLEHIIDFGFFSIISRPIFWLLQKCYSYVGNYGWAIVLLTIIVRIPFIPIVNKGQKSMKGLQKVQPLMAEIKKKYKKNSDQMQKEMMALYKKHKVNPMGGCLPMLLQIPVFFALYKVLMVSIELRGAPFMLWITDLSMKDPYYVMPLVMGATMFLQQRMTPSAGDPKQQKIMMFMPVIFTFMFLNFASGLVLYWLTNNLLSIGQQFYVNSKKD